MYRCADLQKHVLGDWAPKHLGQAAQKAFGKGKLSGIRSARSVAAVSVLTNYGNTALEGFPELKTCFQQHLRKLPFLRKRLFVLSCFLGAEVVSGS